MCSIHLFIYLLFAPKSPQLSSSMAWRISRRNYRTLCGQQHPTRTFERSASLWKIISKMTQFRNRQIDRISAAILHGILSNSIRLIVGGRHSRVHITLQHGGHHLISQGRSSNSIKLKIKSFDPNHYLLHGIIPVEYQHRYRRDRHVVSSS